MKWKEVLSTVFCKRVGMPLVAPEMIRWLCMLHRSTQRWGELSRETSKDRRRRVGLCGENFRKISMGTEKGTGFFV